MPHGNEFSIAAPGSEAGAEGITEPGFRERVKECLATRILGKDLYYRDRVASTNLWARGLALEGAREGTVALAADQWAGRGRRGRSWCCPPGRGLLFSVILEPHFLAPAQAPLLSLAGAVAVCRLCRESLGLAAGVKWPNDVLIRGRKVAGILAELVTESDAVSFLILGVGLNVNQRCEDFPRELKEQATSLLRENGEQLELPRILALLLGFLEEEYQGIRERGSGCFRERFRQHAQGLNAPVRVLGNGVSIVGWARDIDRDGALLLEDQEGEQHRVLAGDVSLLQAGELER